MTMFGGGGKGPFDPSKRKSKRPGTALEDRILKLREQGRSDDWLIEIGERLDKLEAEVAKYRRAEDDTKNAKVDDATKKPDGG